MRFPKPTFHHLGMVDENELKYAVICAQYQGKWIFSRHKERTAWELPGGHIEPGETPMQAAHRELYEETGAVEAEITPVGIYRLFDYGILCFGEIHRLLPIPKDSEIAEITACNTIPEELTYAGVHDQLLAWVQEWLREYKPTV